MVIWLPMSLVAAMILASGALGLWVRRQSAQIQALQAELGELLRAHQATQAQLLALQDTATALEDRLGDLEESDPAQQLAAGTAATAQEITDLQVSLTEIQTRMDALAASLETYASTRGGAAQTLPPEVRLSVARQRQSHNLSCESSAASMAAHYHGVQLSEADVLAALPLDDNPHFGFRGNVDGPTGGIEDYGVYAGPIMAILNDQGLRAQPIVSGLDGIRAAIARNNPVIAWITYDCQPQTPTTVMIDGQEVTLVPYQHAVVVTGYDNMGVWANDPWDGQEDFYPLADFQRAMSYFGEMAVEVAAP
jgi:uncharacterized protein YvpB